MKIPEQLSQQLEQQEEESKKEKSTGNLCPFTFDTLWGLIENTQEGDFNIENLVIIYLNVPDAFTEIY